MSEKVIAVDLYNLNLTGKVCMTIKAARGDNEHTPCVMIKREPIAFSAVQINGRKNENSTPDI